MKLMSKIRERIVGVWNRFRREVSCAALSAAVLILASENGYCSADEHAGISSLVPYWVNFAIYVAVLYFALRRAIPSAWSSRRLSILDSVMSSTKELEAAERAVKDAEVRTKNLISEQDAAKKEIINQAELEAAQIVKAAHDKAARQKAQAQDLIAGETRSAEATFRAELVAKALELAKEKFKSGAYSTKESGYRDAALSRAKRLTQ